MMELNKWNKFKLKARKQEIAVWNEDGEYHLSLRIYADKFSEDTLNIENISYMDLTHLIEVLKEAQQLIKTK